MVTHRRSTPANLSRCYSILHRVALGKRASPPDHTNRLRCPDRLPCDEGKVHPRTIGAFVPLSRFVGPFPIALGIPPKTNQREGQFRRRFGCGERLTKI